MVHNNDINAFSPPFQIDSIITHFSTEESRIIILINRDRIKLHTKKLSRQKQGTMFGCGILNKMTNLAACLKLSTSLTLIRTQC